MLCVLVLVDHGSEPQKHADHKQHKREEVAGRAHVLILQDVCLHSFDQKIRKDLTGLVQYNAALPCNCLLQFWHSSLKQE